MNKWAKEQGKGGKSRIRKSESRSVEGMSRDRKKKRRKKINDM